MTMHCFRFLALAFLVPSLLSAAQPTANNITEAGEVCDGSDLNNLTCRSVVAGFIGGTLKCKADRTGYDTSSCLAGGKTIDVVTTQGAPSCQAVDVQRAVDLAQDGDTVLVPPGTCTWTSPVIVGRYSGSTRTYTGKSIVLQGAGIDRTNIIENISTKGSAVALQLQANKPVRVTGFSFDGSKTVDNYASVSASGSPGQPVFRIDNCKFANITERGIIVNSAYGLIDHNIFLRSPVGSSPTSVSVIGDLSGENNSLTRPQALGTSNAVFIENNTFVQNRGANGPFDMYDGARYVFRLNEVFGPNLGHHGFDSGSGGIANFEIYENQFMNGLPKDSPYFAAYAIVAKSDFSAADSSNGATILAGLLSRGILEETSLTTHVRLKNSSQARPTEIAARAFSRIWGILNGSFIHGIVFEFRSGSGVVFNNKVVGPIDPTTRDTGYYDLFVMLRNYRSSDGYITNYGYPFPWDGLHPRNGVCDGTNSLDGNTPGMQGYPCRDQMGRTSLQALSPVYSWNNDYQGNIGGNMVVGNYATVPPGGADRTKIHIVEGRDFYNGIPRPGYVPYVYPHPLATGEYSPSAPGNLRVQQ